MCGSTNGTVRRMRFDTPEPWTLSFLATTGLSTWFCGTSAQIKSTRRTLTRIWPGPLREPSPPLENSALLVSEGVHQLCGPIRPPEADATGNEPVSKTLERETEVQDFAYAALRPAYAGPLQLGMRWNVSLIDWIPLIGSSG